LALASCVRTLSLETIITDLTVEGDDQTVGVPRQVLRQTAADAYLSLRLQSLYVIELKPVLRMRLINSSDGSMSTYI